MRTLSPIRLIVLFVIWSFNSNGQIPWELYQKLIENKKTESEIEKYWNELHRLDQMVLLNESNPISYDSLSIDNLIKSCLMIESHGIEKVDPNSPVPMLNFSHCNLGKANLIYWKYLRDLSQQDGIIHYFGGEFPAYELEVIALHFYNYSVLNQDSIYPKLLTQLDDHISATPIEDLVQVFEELKKIRGLKSKKVIGTWQESSFKDTYTKNTFKICLKSDKNYYLEFNDNRCPIRLVNVGNSKDSLELQPDGAPFGWYFSLTNKTNLSLVSDSGEILLTYKLQ